MAILNSIRKRGVFLIIIIALALFAFVLDGVINSKTGGGGEIENTVAVINGKELSREDFMGKVENQQRALGPGANTARAVQMVWDRELRTVLMEQQTEALGMTVSQEEINEQLSLVLANNPTFQDENGLYSEAKMIEYVASIQGNDPASRQQLQAWNDFIESTREGILQSNYMNMVRGGLASTLAEGEQQYRFENDKINIEYVYVPYTKIADEDVTVSEAEIGQYIKANPKQFEVDPLVDIQYVMFEEKPSDEDIEAGKAEVASQLDAFAAAEDAGAYVGENSDNSYNDNWVLESNLPVAIKDTILNIPDGSIYGPYQVDNTFNLSKVVARRQLADSAEARHILIPLGLNPTDSITRTPEQARFLADSILTVVKANKSKFADMVTQFSGDPGSIEKGGKYEWFAYNRMVAPFRDFSFEGEVGDMGVVETRFGYHIIEVLGQKDFKPAVKVATVTRNIETTEKTLTDIFSTAAKFEDAARNGEFNTVAEDGGYDAKPVNKIGELDANIPGIGDNRAIINWAFGDESKVGDVSRFDVNNSYVVVQLTRKSTEKALQSVAEASSIVTPILRNKKKAQKIREGISGTTLQDVASSQNEQVKSASALTRSNPTIAGAGTEPAVVGAAFGKAAGESTSLIDGENGVYMVKVLAVNKAPDLENYATFANTLNANASGAISNRIFEALKSAADIEDNRAKFY
ncbi:peptidylprolyl isomerase [Aureisphaera galaxeae]|uniref:peptidylprolyl isomerase n=1 Tax=Aureisphaera galaxeae TaxID=1538023 RepID=UPI00234FFC9C|nr:peptidylprolyl isomerase [Aureisphaera galaxeae]MDC8003021.1 peptidylprolyl isomerase [Aureisphaera galaxeae]